MYIKSGLYVILLTSILVCSCNKPENDNSELEIPVALNPMCNDIKEIANNSKNPLHKEIAVQLSRIDTAKALYIRNCKRNIFKKPRENNLIVYTDDILQIYNSMIVAKKQSNIADTVLKYLPIVRERYVNKNNDADSRRILLLTEWLEQQIVYNYCLAMGCGKNIYNSFASREKYNVGDTVVIMGTMDNSINLVTEEFSFEDENTQVINTTNNEKLTYSIHLTGPIVSIKFIPNTIGEYIITSDIKQTVFYQTSFFGHLTDTIHVE